MHHSACYPTAEAVGYRNVAASAAFDFSEKTETLSGKTENG
jgi:hypothetical protein